MKTFTSEGVSFTLQDTYNIRAQLAYKQRLFAGLTRESEDDNYIRLWRGAVPLLEDWQCELIPDPAALDVDKEDNPFIADIVFYVGNVVWSHMDRLGQVPKN